MSFRMRCPKCHSSNLDLEEDQRAFLGGGRHQVLLHCYTCGMILYGEERIQEEFERQRAEWEKQVNERQERAARARAARAARAAVRPRPKPRPKAAATATATAAAGRSGTPATISPGQSPNSRTAAAPAVVAPKPGVVSTESVNRAAQAPVSAPAAAAPAPATAKDNGPVLNPDTGCLVCAWKTCEKIARPNSKYCSRNCSNKNARARHAVRKKKKKVVEPDDSSSSIQA
jgi:hypothetical protein